MKAPGVPAGLGLQVPKHKQLRQRQSELAGQGDPPRLWPEGVTRWAAEESQLSGKREAGSEPSGRQAESFQALKCNHRLQLRFAWLDFKHRQRLRLAVHGPLSNPEHLILVLPLARHGLPGASGPTGGQVGRLAPCTGGLCLLDELGPLLRARLPQCTRQAFALERTHDGMRLWGLEGWECSAIATVIEVDLG